MTSQHRKDSSVTGSPPQKPQTQTILVKEFYLFLSDHQVVVSLKCWEVQISKGKPAGCRCCRDGHEVEEKKNKDVGNAKKYIPCLGFPISSPKFGVFPNKPVRKSPKPVKLWDRLVFRSSTGRTFGSFGGWLQWCGMAIRWGLDIAWNFEVPKI